jgi:orotate phosphoribosyltransferase
VAEDVQQLLRRVGAVLDGHFLLTSGRHSPLYVEKFRLLEQPPYTERLCRLIADHFRPQGVQLVAAPTTGGIVLSYEVARQVGVRGIFAEKEGKGRRFGRGFRLAPGERTLVVDDVLTTGGSIREVIDAVRREGAEPIGVGVLVDRSGGRADFGLPFFACVALDLPTYAPDDCPLCAQNVTLTVT